MIGSDVPASSARPDLVATDDQLAYGKYVGTSIERLFRHRQQERIRSILPLVMDLTDPSPALGWQGRERRALTDRVRPDIVLCLALVHHLAIASRTFPTTCTELELRRQDCHRDPGAFLYICGLPGAPAGRGFAIVQ
jgi:hypothetical protein